MTDKPTNLPPNYNWLNPDDYAKLLFRTRAHYTRILSGLRKWYGQEAEVDGAIEALLYVTEQTWEIVRGKDKSIKSPPFFNRYDDDNYSPDD